MIYLLLEALCSWPILREATYFDPNKMLAAPNPFFPSFLETALHLMRHHSFESLPIPPKIAGYLARDRSALSVVDTRLF